MHAQLSLSKICNGIDHAYTQLFNFLSYAMLSNTKHNLKSLHINIMNCYFLSNLSTIDKPMKTKRNKFYHIGTLIFNVCTQESQPELFIIFFYQIKSCLRFGHNKFLLIVSVLSILCERKLRLLSYSCSSNFQKLIGVITI